MKTKSTLLIFSCVLIMVHVSCSSGGNNPVTSSSLSNFQDSRTALPLGVSDWLSNGFPSAGMGALGLFELHLDPVNIQAELTSLRKNQMKDVLEVVDITNFLEMAPCTDCAKIKSISMDVDENIVVTIGIKHPFAAGDPFKPISGKNRGDLHVFNIEGIIVSDNPVITFGGLNDSIADFDLLNADGYTGYLDDVLDDLYPTDATIHPYIMHFDDYSTGNFSPGNPMGFESVTDPPPSGNLVMAMGCDYDYQDYVFKLNEIEPVNFMLAVGCTYGVSANTMVDRFTPEYRIPQHNKKAASEIDLLITNNELKAGDTSSTAEIEIHVVDVNHGVEVGDELDKMLADSSVGEIDVDIPGVMTDILEIDGSTAISGSGHDPSDPLIYTATITNTSGTNLGTYSGLIKVIDAYPVGQNTSPFLAGMDGIQRVDPKENPLEGLFEIDEFATYQTFTIDISSGDLPPVVGTISLEWECPGDPCAGIPFTLTVSEAYDPDGLPVTITWDFDGNLDFNDDMDGDDSNLSGEYVYSDPGAYEAWCRVSDQTLYTDAGPYAITIRSCIPENPSIITSVESAWDPTGQNNDRARKIALNSEGGYAYVIQDNGNGGAVAIFDIDPPQDAYEVKYVDLGVWSATCAYYNGYVYAAGQAMEGINTIDVDPPEDASIVNTWSDWNFTGSMEDMLVQNEYLFVAGQWGGFMVFSLADPSNPTLVSNSPTNGPRYTGSIMVSPDMQWGYFLEGYSDATTDWLRVLDISDINNLELVHSVEMPTFQMECDLQGNYLFCIPHPWTGGPLLNIVNVSDPTSAYVETSFSIGSGTYDLRARGNYLYVTRSDFFNFSNLTILDITDPANPSLFNTIDIEDQTWGLEEHCGIAYVTSKNPSITLVELY